MCESTRRHFRLVSDAARCEAGMCNVYMDHIMKEPKVEFSGGVKLEVKMCNFSNLWMT